MIVRSGYRHLLVLCALVGILCDANAKAQVVGSPIGVDSPWEPQPTTTIWTGPAPPLEPVPPKSQWISQQNLPLLWDDPGWDDPGWDDPGWDDPGLTNQSLKSMPPAAWPVDQVSWNDDRPHGGETIQRSVSDAAVTATCLVGCSNCLVGSSNTGSCLTCRDGLCTPGRTECYPCTAKTRIGRFGCEIYRALCCPDPCYDPKWTPVADSAFFVEAVRPVTQQRLRWDAGLNMLYPDRAEYFWARADGSGKGPNPPSPWHGVRSLDYHDLSLYTETSSGKFSLFLNQPYRSVYPSDGGHGAGLGAMDIGTKSLVFDCELVQIAFQFRTYMPLGNTTKGLGNGHVSLEPSLIVGLRLSHDSYFQGQIAEWIPLGGDTTYEGAILHYHASVNHIWFRMLPDVPLIATFELNGWSFQDGAYTDPVLGTLLASGETYLSIGPGLRLSVCDRVDFGVGAAFALTGDHFAEQLIRSEFRWRF